MSKYMLVFSMRNQLLYFNVDELLNNTTENYLTSLVMPFDEDILFPFCHENNHYYVYNGAENWEIKLDGEEINSKTEVAHGSYITFKSKKCSYSILFIDVLKQSLSANCYEVKCGQKIFIGRAPENNIIIDINASVSRKHAAIWIDETGKGYIEDLARKTGVFLNRKKVTSSELVCGDLIEIMGNTLCFMSEYVIVPKHLHVNGLQAVKSLDLIQPKEYEKEDFYVRTPRILKSLDTDKIVIEPPTQPQKSKETPFILVAGPSATMAFGMLASFGVTLTNALNGGNIGSTITGGVMVVSMLLGSLMWPSLLRSYNKRQSIANEKYRVEKYRYYLGEKEQEIKKLYDRNTRIWNENLLPSVSKIAQIITDRSINLWERSVFDDDFLEVRLGIGSKDFEIELQSPQKGFELHDDALVDEARALSQKYKLLNNVPISISLNRKRTIGVVGTEERIYDFIRCMIINIAALHSPEDVKICVICNELQSEKMKWMKELPHCWNTAKNLRYFVANYAEAYRLLNELDEKIQSREALLDKDSIRTPHIITFVLDVALVESIPFYRYLIDPDNNVGVSSVFVAEQFNKIPKECVAIIQNEDNTCGIYTKNENKNRFINFKADQLSIEEAEKLSSNLSRIPMKIEKGKLDVPESISFLDMYKVGNVESLYIEQRWENNHSDKSLAVPLGVKAGGELFSLDIHEKYHGCHGLVAGMTGSGKSEFLQAYILSAILNYSPNEIAFVLVDFKGGDMARPFLKIPHLSATISNLSGNILYRALVSLEAEVKSRQNIFNESANILGIDKIDINSYHKYFKEGRLSLPLPHLVIVIDEFAQLKSQQPEFMARLVDIAQVGRSLGIHLILATQKPSGVVDPQIWSNSRFKVCLKVLDKQDSVEMINRADAALIKLPGRAYIQVGYDEIFEQIQSGYSGTDYIPQKEYTDDEDITVKLIDSAAMPLRMAKSIANNIKTGKTQLEETVSEVIKIGEKKNLRVKPLWLEPLKETVYLSGCIDGFNYDVEALSWDKDNDISITCGLIDILETQQQIPYTVSLVKSGHVAIYGSSGTGKTTLMQTMIFSLTLRYSPELLNIFAMDFGGRNLGILSSLPHCVNVAFGEEEEKVSYMLRQILESIDQRKKLFAENNCTTYESYLLTTKTKLPAIVLLLDNYSAFREKMFKNEDDIVRIVANAKAYGIYLIITGNSKNAIYYKVAEHISNNITLRMNDKMNYRDILNVQMPIEPENIKGRGLLIHNKAAVEFQAALPFEYENEAQRTDSMRKIYEQMAEKYDGVAASSLYQEIPELKNNEQVEVKPQIIINEKKTLSVMKALQDNQHNIICGTSNISGQLQGFELYNTQCVFIATNGSNYPNRALEKIDALDNAIVYTICPSYDEQMGGRNISSSSEIHDLIDFLKSEMTLRRNDLQMIKAAELDESDIYGYMQKHKRVFLIIKDFCRFYDVISDSDLKELLSLLKEQAQSGIYVITIDNLERMSAYYDTALFVALVKAKRGMIIGGNISDAQVGRLTSKFSEIPVAERSKKLSENQAFLYDENKWSIITID